MDTLDAMRVFVRVAECSSFTQAASDLNLPRSTVTEAVKQLETRLGTPLLQRTTRSVSTTLDGRTYLSHVQLILADLESLENTFSSGAPKGRLRIDVHGSLARHFILPQLPDFLARYPELDIYMSENDRFVDPVKEGFDCVVRVGTLQDSDMMGHQIAKLEEVTLASPAYLAQHGTPERPDALNHHKMVGFHSSTSGSDLPLEFCRAGGKQPPWEIHLPATIRVNAAESYLAAALQGMGLIQVPRYHAETLIATGRLIPVLTEYPPLPSPVSLLYPRSKQLSPRLRVFRDWLIQVFQNHS